MKIFQLPKVELHVHLDCSLSFEVVRLLDPDIDKDRYLHDFVADATCMNLQDYLRKAEGGIRLMQDPEGLRLVTLDLIDQLAKDRVIYAEVRFAPLLHLRQGLTPEQVVTVVDEAMHEGMQKTGLEGGLILCTLRHFSEAESLETVKLVERFRSSGTVLGFDIAGDEAGFPVDAHVPAFDYAHANGIPCTAHAGEACGAGSVEETMKIFGPSRIGHGVRSIEDPMLVDGLKKAGIHLEICPTSNLRTHIYAKMNFHPIDQLYKMGVSLGVNTDGRAISSVSLSEEYEKLKRTFGWGKEEWLRCNLSAIDAAFTSAEVKKKVRNRLVEAYQHLSVRNG